jgi:hypothetical protein
VLRRPERLSSPTDPWPALKHECHSKTAVQLKASPKHFRGFSSGFIDLHAKLEADALLNFAIHCRQNETRSQKSTHIKIMRVHRAVSCGKLMQ